MTRRNQIATGLLVAILSLLAYQIYGYTRPAGAVVVATAAGPGFVPLAVENPALRMDLLDQLKKFEYEGPRRNIFSTGPVVPVAPPPQPVAPPISVGPVALPGPPPLVVPATFFGRVTDKSSGASRAFFSQGDEVYVLGLGEVLLSRFRLVQIGETTAELEELNSGRRTTVTMEQPAS
jgi:hypothetical protein